MIPAPALEIAVLLWGLVLLLVESFAGESVPARQVHAAFLAALNGFYAKVIRADEL